MREAEPMLNFRYKQSTMGLVEIMLILVGGKVSSKPPAYGEVERRWNSRK